MSAGEANRAESASGRPITMFTGGTVWIGDPPTPRKGWVLVADGRIRAHGMGSVLGNAEATNVVDCRGRHVLPGFVDAHTHLSSGTLLAGQLDGSPWRDRRAALDHVRAAASGIPGRPGRRLRWAPGVAGRRVASPWHVVHPGAV